MRDLSFRLLGGAYHFQIASQRARKALFTCVVINWIYYTEFVIEHTAPLCELILTWKFRFFSLRSPIIVDASQDMESACVHGFNFMILLKNLSLQSGLEKRKFTFSLNFFRLWSCASLACSFYDQNIKTWIRNTKFLVESIARWYFFCSYHLQVIHQRFLGTIRFLLVVQLITRTQFKP